MDDDDKPDTDPELEDDDTGDADPPEDDGDADQQTEAEKKLAAALKKARAERNEARKKLAEARKAADDTGKGDQKGADEAVARLTGTLVRQAAVTELIAAGLERDAAKRAVRLLDLDGVEVDSSGDVDLDDQIEGLKEDFPELFSPKKGSATPPVRRTSEDGRRNNGKSVDDRFADRLMKSAGYR
jgi:hypothetical protein